MGYVDHMMAFELLLSMEPEDLHSFFHRLYLGMVYQAVFCACIAIVVWEHVLHMPAEIRTWQLLLQGHILPARLAILIVRYVTLASILFAALFLWSGLQACGPLFYAHYVGYCILWAASTSIFLMRLNIIFISNRAIMTGYLILWLCCLSAWIFTVTQIRSHYIPPQMSMPYMTLCFSEVYPSLGVISWCASVIFDSSVFFGTYLRFRSTLKTTKTVTQFRTRKWSFEANLYYFGTSCAFNISCLISALKVKDPLLSHIGSLVAMTHHCIIATRLVFSAKGWAKHIGRDDDLILNTFNKRARARMLGITYTVDETIVIDSKELHERRLGQEENACSPQLDLTRHHLRIDSIDPFDPHHTPTTGTDSKSTGSRSRCVRRGSYHGGGGDPISPLPDLHDMKMESREALVDTESKRSSKSDGLTALKQYHFRAKRHPHSPTSPKSQRRGSSRMASPTYLNETTSAPSAIPSLYFTHPYRAVDANYQETEGGSRCKKDHEVDHRHLQSDHNLLSPTSTLCASRSPTTDHALKGEPSPKYHQ